MPAFSVSRVTVSAPEKQTGHINVDLRLRRGGEVFVGVGFAHRVAEVRVKRGERALFARLLLRGALDGEFDIETFSGDIENCFGPKPVRTREFAPGNALRFKQGAGNARVRVKTFSGTVEICKD